MNISVLLLIYHCPERTRRIFRAIKKAKPKRLFVAADGPSSERPDDFEFCRLAREVTENVDWDCKVERLYRDKNLGLEDAVYSAVSWFFNNVDEGIILEDDCLAGQSFFSFCENMLSKYRKDKNILHIGGSNFLPENIQKSDGYYFSKYPEIWGWATWKRAWGLMDFKMKNWKRFEKSKDLDLILPDFWEKKYWQIIANAVLSEKVNSWGYRWLFSIWENHGKCVSPGVNLVENIGLASGTHVNTNAKLRVHSKTIIDNPEVLSESYSKGADDYLKDHIYRVSPLMDFAQWLYFAIKNV